MGISDLERVKFVNCLHVDNSSGYWFGGIIRTDENWPIRFRHIPYHMGLTGSARWHGDSVIGIFEPSWFSSHSAAISISRKIPFYTNQTTNKLCFKSDKTANYLMYKVCRARDVVDIIRSREQYLQTTSSADDIEKEFPTIGSVIIDIDIDSQGNLSHNLMKVCQTMRNLRLPIKAMYLIKEVDLFQKLDMNAISRTIAACRTNHTFFAAEFGCYVRIRDVENEFIDVTMLVSQHNGSSIGAVQVRNETCFVLDFTKWKVRCWYADQVCKNPLYALVDYVAFYGGSASSLPVESTLNVTLGNLNLYSTAYVDVAWSIAKGLIVDVAYGTQTVPLFINIPTTLEHERNVIAMLLAASLQGYNMFVIQLDSNIPEYASMDEQQRNRLRSWLQLAMVMPMLRVPASIIHNPIFYENLNYYKPIRDKYVLPHYHKAYLQNRLFGDPVMRPIWWFAKDRSSLLTYNHQFMIGNDLIVAAFLHSNEVNYRLYLPPGKWINPDTNVTNDGGTVITVHIGMKYNVVCFIRAEKLTDKPF
ncbi:unnamed protein product [Soboliphyme baturini]|uniref:Protein kinase domain-containing protein n=1 Tax=Soboliphyme baturini TaxID=241478 RepID=A0A183ILQ0_9BILA|nr:unnamed protein product [Soboliphyme baturini]